MNPNRFTPRQQVIFFYLALVRRGKEAGLPRQSSQTPYEYARSLELGLVEQTDALMDMTERFLDARYSPHEVTPEQVSRAKQAWEQVRKALMAIRKRSGGGKLGVTGK